MDNLSRIQSIVQFVLFCSVLMVTSCSKPVALGPVYDGDSDAAKAMTYMGTPVKMTLEGRIVTSGPYFEFARELVGIWMKEDKKALHSKLSSDTIKFHGSEKYYWEFWKKGMMEHMLLGSRDDPKVVATLVENLSENPMHQAQSKWFDFPQEPEVALILYSFSPSSGMQGRMFYPVLKNGKMRLLLEKPKPTDGDH